MSITVVGLGPAGLDRVGPPGRAAVLAPDAHVVVRTLEHPAARELAALRDVESGDDLYRSAPDFDALYEALGERVLAAARRGPVVYAVPGSALVGERSVTMLRGRADAAGIAVAIIPGESFLDLVYARTGLDPIADGMQVVDGRDLPDPLVLHLPTVVTQVDQPVVLADVGAVLSRLLADDTPITVLTELGSPGEVVTTVPLADLHAAAPGPRTSLYLAPVAVGWYGLVRTNRRLRAECPWDRAQTHHSLVTHLVEEAYETVEALGALAEDAPGGDPDFGVYAAVEEELGDLLLQVVFHATLAREAGAFDVEEVAEGIRRKLVRRHPHVFGDVHAPTADHVIANWELLKADEKARHSLMDDVPTSLPAIARADKLQKRAATVGFDWPSIEPVAAKLDEEVAELHADIDDPGRAGAELGDVLFAAVNLARHLRVDPELALRRANERFAARFRRLESLAAASGRDLAGMPLEEMDTLWDRAKREEA